MGKDTSRLRRIAPLLVVCVLAFSTSGPAWLPAIVIDTEAAGSSLTISVAYADNLRASGFFPNPWQGSPNVNFIGTAPGSQYDSGAIRVHNSSATAATVDDVSVTIGGSTFDLWGSGLNVPAGGDLIVAQTNGENFDSSDVSGVFNCTPSGLVPQVTVTVGGVRTAYQDSSQVLNTGGIDLAGCPQGTNESQPWSQLGGGLVSNQLLGNGSTASPQVPNCHSGDAVNCATGNFTEVFDEMRVPGRGLPLDLALTYNGLAAAQNSPVGFGWSFSYGVLLVVNSGASTATVILGDGNNVTFGLSNGAYLAPPWVMATLTQNPDGTFTYLETRTQRKFLFLSGGQLSKETDRNGYVTGISYNASGQIVAVIDPASRTFNFSYGTSGNLSSVTDPTNRKVTFGPPDSAGNLPSITDVAGGLTRFTYDSSHHMLTLTDPRNGVLTNTYDSLGRVTSQVDPMNRTTTWSYVAGTTTITDPNGSATREHFSNLEPVAITRGYGTSVEATWNYGYDLNMLGLTSATDPNHHLTTFSWDSNANLLSATDALSHTGTFTYDSLNDLTSATNRLNVTTTYTYDSHGNVLTAATPLTGTSQTQSVTFSYGDSLHPGDITGITDPDGHVVLLSYDSNGDLVSATDALGDKTTYGYDLIGRRTSTLSPNGNVTGGNPSQNTTSYSYNVFGDVTGITNPLDHSAVITYDGHRNLVSLTDPDANKVQYRYDADNELTIVTRADLTTLTYGYDGDGNQISQTDANKNTTKYAFDPLSRVSSITDPLNRITTYLYDGVGNLTSLTNAANLSTSFSYDPLNQLTGITYASATTPNASYTFDAGGRRTTMSDRTGTTSYSYNSLNRLTSVTDGAGQTVGYTYDLNGNLSAIAYPNGKQVTYTFNSANQMTAVADWMNNTTSFGYDANGNLVTQNYPNTTKAALAYDAANQLSQIVDSKSGTTFASFGYTHDNAGLVASVAPTGVSQGNETYTYTALSQLASVNTSTYKYDPGDNVTQLASAASLTYDAADELKSFTQGSSTTTYGYDAQGNRTSATPASGAETTYTYDQANRLIQAVVPGASNGLVAAGGFFDLAVRTDGTVWGWGENKYGELGTGSTSSFSNTPVQVPGFTGAISVAAGFYHSLALKNDGSVWAWGKDGFGQLGNGVFEGLSATPVQVSGLTGASAIATGGFHSLAALSNGSVEAWGYNNSGQLGNGTTTNSNTPVPVSLLNNVTMVSGGAYHSLALKADGTVWSWGANDSGQLGTGTTAASSTPVQVKNLTNVTAIAAGASNSSYALRSDGTMWAWGDNSYGQLGNSAAGHTATLPVQVPLANLTGIGAGDTFASAIKSDGTAWSWGNNNRNQVGSTACTSKTCSVPVQVSNLSNVAFIAGGSGLNGLATRSDGTVWAWGDNTWGEAGNGTSTNPEPVPVQVSNLTSVLSQRTASYAYNGDGLRTSKTVNTNAESFSWAFVKGLPLLIQDAGTQFVYGPGGVPIEQVGSSGIPTYLHQDQLGSTRLLTDTSGNVAGSYTYGAYGLASSHTGTASTTLQFAGQYLDSETGLYYMRARYYDAQTGQFISRDPMTWATGHPYGYANGNPINFTDPTGLLSLGDIWNFLSTWAEPLGALASAGAIIFGAIVPLAVFFEATSAVLSVVQGINDAAKGNWLGAAVAIAAGIAGSAAIFLRFVALAKEAAMAAAEGQSLIVILRTSYASLIAVFDLGALARMAYQLARAREIAGSIIANALDAIGMLMTILSEPPPIINAGDTSGGSSPGPAAPGC